MCAYEQLTADAAERGVPPSSGSGMLSPYVGLFGQSAYVAFCWTS